MWKDVWSVLRMVTMPIKNFLITVKNRLSSLVPTRSNMMLNYGKHCSTCMSLNCQEPSSCMMLNYPSHSSMILEHSSCAYGPRDCLTTRMDSTTNSASLQTCPDLDPSSSMDSIQTHDLLATPESPRTHPPSPYDSLEEGSMNDSAEMAQDTQVRTDSLAYDSLITALSWLSLEPGPDPLLDHHHDSFPPLPWSRSYRIIWYDRQFWLILD